jgi:ubiquitin-like protein Nedd8
LNVALIVPQVLSMKEKLEEKEGITVSQQRLVFEGKSMENDKTMADFGITAGKTLHMVLSLRGGC